ncbi:MAG: DNA repair protein RecO [Sphaerochaetaceae bacterium]|nr:DNA repair protein RecO [Sphaerochaetaceae bacterium]MDC7247532.1 DNA repair protein RecO [Sphaerochaetaceae bacterium]
MERNVESDVIVLTSRKWGSLHRRVTMLSKELGVFDAIVYGAQKGKLSGACESFTRGKAYLYYQSVRKEYSLKDMAIESSSEILRGDLVRLYSAHAMVEIVMKMHGGDYEKLFDLLESSLAFVDERSFDPTLVLIQFMWSVISVTGFESDLHICPVCGHQYEESEIVSFNPSLHSICCSTCSPRLPEFSRLYLHPGMRRYFLFTSSLPAIEAVKVEVSEKAKRRILHYLIDYIHNILGYSLKSLQDDSLII